jgi:hypothetical protein
MKVWMPTFWLRLPHGLLPRQENKRPGARPGLS